MSIPPASTAVSPSSTTAPPASSVLPQLPASTSALVPTSSQPLAQDVQGVPRAVFTPEQTTAAIVDLSHSMAELRLTMNSVLQLFNNPPPQQPLLPQINPSGAIQPSAAASYTYGMTHQATPSTSPLPPSSSVPIHQLRFPPSPSQIPPWALSYSGPVYTSVPPRSHVPENGAPTMSGTLYSDTNGLLIPGGNLAPSAPSYPETGYEGGAPAAAQHNGPPKFHRIEFTTYDGSVDPLNWLTHCEQFFRGQHTPASQHTWMASYHLTGDAQTWYYALEQDEGQPPRDRFKELCRLRFGPPIRGSRLAELGRLPFHSTVEEFAGRFQADLAHAWDISTRQKAELFVGGLPDHIRADVEMHDPGDL